MNFLLKAGQPGRSSCPQRHLTDLFKLITRLSVWLLTFVLLTEMHIYLGGHIKFALKPLC